MSQRATFHVKVTEEDRLVFAALSGDNNPLHVDSAYAENTEFKRCVLHGAFSAGLISRMAGMHLPGTACLLHGIRLRFLKPIFSPIDLEVEGDMNRDDGENGEVTVNIRDSNTGQLLVDGSYQFGRHTHINSIVSAAPVSLPIGLAGTHVLVTGASGGLGAAVLAAIGQRGVGVTRGVHDNLVTVQDLEKIENHDICQSIDAIIHCAWPPPSNDALLDIVNTPKQFEFNITRPLRECLALARLLRSKGNPGGLLILVGSSASSPGRHSWRMPMYSLAKSMMPILTKILALELSVSGHRVVAINFDVIDGGMNMGISNATRQSHADRTPTGILPSLSDAADQICWILDNSGFLVSGGTIDLTGGAVP
jgi:acyl dehydratase/NAD(P)-dependent dehydrogenase (short-subunit alcohol dehydrogenase family)